MKKAIYNALNYVLFISLIGLVIISMITNQLDYSLIGMILIKMYIDGVK